MDLEILRGCASCASVAAESYEATGKLGGSDVTYKGTCSWLEDILPYSTHVKLLHTQPSILSDE